jgi:sugar/nucleoside kinase (ribokinase family)
VPKDHLVAIGEAFEDFIFIDLPHIPEPGEEVKTDRFLRTVGGGVVITAIAAARLQLRCRVISGLSPFVARRLRGEGVAVRNLRQPNEPFAISAALSTRRERSFVTYNGINDWLEDRLEGPARRVRAVHVHLAFCPRECRRWVNVVQALRKRGVTISWDFGWNESLLKDPDFRRLLKAVDYLFVNDQEVLLYSGFATLHRAEEYWQRNTRNTILKLGSQGSRWLSPDLRLDAPPIQVEALDTTGAGDAFDGGFLAGVIRQMNPRQCLELGNLVGGLSTRAAGGAEALPSQGELP